MTGLVMGGQVVLIRKFDHLGQWVQSGKTVGEFAVVGRAVLADQAPQMGTRICRKLSSLSSCRELASSSAGIESA